MVAMNDGVSAASGFEDKDGSTRNDGVAGMRARRLLTRSKYDIELFVVGLDRASVKLGRACMACMETHN